MSNFQSPSELRGWTFRIMYSELLWSVRYLSPVGTQKSLIEVDSMPACVIIFKGRQSMAPGKGKNCFLQSGLSITKLYCKKQKNQINSTSLHSKHFSTRPCHAMQIVTDLSAVDLSAVHCSHPCCLVHPVFALYLSSVTHWSLQSNIYLLSFRNCLTLANFL